MMDVEPFAMQALGIAAAVFIAWLVTRATQVSRRPKLIGVAAGVAFWFAGNGVVGLLHQPQPLPDVQLATLDDQPMSLTSYTGRPTVVNLWATWCPPCRREMPVFEHAQAEFPGVAIVMVNQGESARQAQAFLDSEELSFSDVLLDPFSRTMQVTGTRVLPSTLFFDAQGQWVDSHVGEITTANLESRILRHFMSGSQLDSDEE